MYAIREVDGVEEEDILRELQVRCLPYDKPMDTSDGYWWLAVDCGGEPVAFAGLTLISDCDGYLCRSGVVPPHRGQGLQKRLIRAREAKARRLLLDLLISDTLNNPASANSLIGCGFRLYVPAEPWGVAQTLYWKKDLT